MLYLDFFFNFPGLEWLATHLWQGSTARLRTSEKSSQLNDLCNVTWWCSIHPLYIQISLLWVFYPKITSVEPFPLWYTNIDIIIYLYKPKWLFSCRTWLMSYPEWKKKRVTVALRSYYRNYSKLDFADFNRSRKVSTHIQIKWLENWYIEGYIQLIYWMCFKSKRLSWKRSVLASLTQEEDK